MNADSPKIVSYLAFGCALDPRQGQLFGQNAPLLVGLSLGLVSFAGSNLGKLTFYGDNASERRGHPD